MANDFRIDREHLKPLPVGRSEWADFSQKSYTVDKTLLIKQLLDDDTGVALFTRPRRFGKMTAMRMVKAFFEKTPKDTSYLFKPFRIWAAGEKYRAEQGTGAGDGMKFSHCLVALGAAALVSRAVAGGSDPAWIRVAASDSRAEARAAADFACTGTNDELTVQKAVDACKASGKQLFLFSGLYNLGSVGDFGDGGPKAAVCFRNMHREFAVVGERRQLTGMAEGMAVNGVVLFLQPEGLRGIRDEPVDILRGEWSALGIMNGSGLRLENVAVFAPDSQCAVRAVDLRRVNSAELHNVQLCAFGMAKLKRGLKYPYGNPPPPHPENIGITLTDGSNNAPVNLTYVTAVGFGQGFQVGGEHVVMVNCAATFGGYGFTFGNYPYHCAFNHPITLVNCCDEQNIHLPLFNSCGDRGGQLHGRQEVTMISFNCERVAAHAPGGKLGDLMREVRPGTWRGNIGFTRQPDWNAVNSVDQPIWAEDGSGSGFVTRNNAHRPACGTVERLSYYPQYMQQVYDTDLNKLLICTDPAKRVWRDAMGNVVSSGK